MARRHPNRCLSHSLPQSLWDVLGKNVMLTQERLKEFLFYDNKTGCFYRHKSFKTGKQIPYKLVGTQRPDGYLSTCIDGKTYLLHRLAWLYVHNKWPDDVIDHINGNKSDNKITNLRSVTQSQNLINRDFDRKSNYKIGGVYWNKGKNAWMVRITINKKQVYMGLYDDFFEACCVRKSAVNTYYGEYAYKERKQ